jgi:hypothetical protein
MPRAGCDRRNLKNAASDVKKDGKMLGRLF